MKVKQFLTEYALLTLGTALVAMGTYFFKFPNHFSTGGVTGIAVILSSIFPAVSSSLFASVINVAFLLLGFGVLNRGFGVRTVYCSLLFSGMLAGLEWLVPLSGPLTDEKLLELFFGVILPALGSAILFNTQGSTGGTDILAMILKKFTSLDIGMALLYVDVLIAGSTLVLIDIETGLFSLLGLVLKSVLVDSVIESLNRKKSFILVTSCPEEVCDFITHTLHRSATFWKGEGAYSHQDKWVVLTALSRAQAVALRRHLKAIDPHAFMLITNSSEIFGKGFLRA
ncbi:YitT family protein [Pseudoflavonifractor sp. SW1122]|uniref:YitT family protein n=1 Tax=Pseudoflavonifractor sp. SW1122 TaxID=2530044 RepID=UPI001439C85A|nr:YitT family protein [Pseudoflavonifractor sp. SW1122]NJE74607.1 YitT family protein [Pseudoflavonifractor sp. SW1122]